MQNISRPTRLVSGRWSWRVGYDDSHNAAFGEYGVLREGARRTRLFHGTGPALRKQPTQLRQTQVLDLLPVLGLQPASLQRSICPPDQLVRIIILCYIYFQ